MPHNGSVWTFNPRTFDALSGGPHRFEIVVVGAGITGITAAILLAKQGRRVAVLDAAGPGSGETLRSTAHLTQVLDTRFLSLKERLGESNARILVHHHKDAIDQIETLASEADVPHAFERMTGTLVAASPEQAANLIEEQAAASSLGVDVSKRCAEIPLNGIAGLDFPNQAVLDVGLYLAGLVELAIQHGVTIFAPVRVESIDERVEDVLLHCNDTDVVAQFVVVATHSNIANTFALHTRTPPSRTYAVAIAAPQAAVKQMIWDMADPYHYVRPVTVSGKELLIVGGEDHRVGEEEHPEQRFLRLLNFAEVNFGSREALFQWSGQILESVDDLPYIGLAPHHKLTYVGTGYSGNGITNGTLAANMISSQILGQPHPLKEILSPSRGVGLSSVKQFARHNVDVAKHLVGDRLAKVTDGPGLKAHTGSIVEQSGKKLAVYLDEAGGVYALSAVCPHLGCRVAWNQVESTWDCPCHGSRFDCRGRVLNGPATSDLEPVELARS